MNGARVAVFVAVGVVLMIGAGCADGDKRGGDSDGGMRCVADPDCNDGFDCTSDSCGVGMVCVFTPLDALCEDGETCEVGRGCVSGGTCTMASECDDMIECTVDSCGVSGTCQHRPIHELCTNPEMPMCEVGMGCIAGTGCSGDAECDDMVSCTVDSCNVARMCEHMTIDALCTGEGEVCSATRGCFVPMPCTTDPECDDGNFCNGPEICVEEFGCAPAEMPRVCNDSEDCTVDSCDTTADMCVFRCDPTLGSECVAMCPPPSAACGGRFRLTGSGTSFGCGACTSVDFSEATFVNEDGILTVESRRYMTMPPVPGGLVLSDTAEPICPMFDATVVVSGGCEERYRIFGMFTDDDNFTATIEWEFIDMDGFSCVFCGCTSGSGTVTGTRIP